MIYTSLFQLVGKTPLLELTHIEEEYQLTSKILAKLEYLNPFGSVKDRAAMYMLEDASRKGILNKDTTIIELTSGNTGISLAGAAAALGYILFIVMPDNASLERQQILKAYGAKVFLSRGELGMKGAAALAKELSLQYPGSIILDQFSNLSNVNAHFETTGPEIYEATGGNIDLFICGVGTGAAITGTGKYLKQKNTDIKIFAVEPKASPVLSGGSLHPHKIQGLGAGFIPDVLDTSIYDDVITVSDEDALSTMRILAEKEGILAGISSGAVLWAAIQAARASKTSFENIVILLADSGERYLSAKLFV